MYELMERLQHPDITRLIRDGLPEADDLPEIAYCEKCGEAFPGDDDFICGVCPDCVSEAFYDNEVMCRYLSETVWHGEEGTRDAAFLRDNFEQITRLLKAEIIETFIEYGLYTRLKNLMNRHVLKLPEEWREAEAEKLWGILRGYAGLDTEDYIDWYKEVIK